jgi:hypothetical protein
MVYRYIVTVNGVEREWNTLDYAFTDLFARGYDSAGWTLVKEPVEDNT